MAHKMPDLLLTGTLQNPNWDISTSGGDVVTDSGLQTAVYISLFTDAYDPDANAGGYWGDTVDDQPNGSRLWTLARSVIDDNLPAKIEAICEEALQWLIDNNIAQSVDVTATVVGPNNPNAVSIQINITQADASTLSMTYAYNWQNQFVTGF